jgi:predicted ester cyclase
VTDIVALALEFNREVQTNGRLDLVDHYVHPDFRNGTAEPGVVDGRDGVRATMAALHAAFADLTLEIVHCFGHDDVVATHKILRGRHVGPWLGQQPTGEPVALRVMDFLRFADGKIIEHWSALRPVARV